MQTQRIEGTWPGGVVHGDGSTQNATRARPSIPVLTLTLTCAAGQVGASNGVWNPNIRPFDAQRAAIGDRRYLGGFDARFHSTNSYALDLRHSAVAEAGFLSERNC